MNQFTIRRFEFTRQLPTDLAKLDHTIRQHYFEYYLIGEEGNIPNYIDHKLRVNWLRHNCTRYEAELQRSRDFDGKSRYRKIREYYDNCINDWAQKLYGHHFNVGKYKHSFGAYDRLLINSYGPYKWTPYGFYKRSSHVRGTGNTKN